MTERIKRLAWIAASTVAYLVTLGAF